MDKWLKQREDLLRSAKSLIDARKSADVDLSPDDRAHLKSVADQVDALDAKIAAVRKDAPILDAFNRHIDGPQTAGSQDQHQGGDDYAAKSIGPGTAGVVARQLVKSATAPDGVKALIDGGTGTSDLVVGLSALPTTPKTILEAIPQVRLQSPPTYRHLVQVARTPNAGVVAPGAEKPVTSMSLEERDGRLKVIATLSDEIGVYTLQDVATLNQFVTSELQYSLMTALEEEVIDGDGTGEHFTGLLNTSGVLTQAFATDLLTTVRTAITQVESQGYRPGVVVLSPSDWQTAELAQTSGSGEFFLASSPVNRAEQKLWGVPVALSTALPAGQALLMSQDSATIYTDGRVSLEWDRSSGFSKNTVVARLETRADLAVVRPAGIVKIATA